MQVAAGPVRASVLGSYGKATHSEFVILKSTCPETQACLATKLGTFEQSRAGLPEPWAFGSFNVSPCLISVFFPRLVLQKYGLPTEQLGVTRNGV